eukprot:CAMPEP_0174724984 /NCGR_PEP_ID=MMETSP1094-20130205/44589_1 /TAXON_ID=156173 /ORGANISM="Chrysochromulina brevifilum, Strain UTEX LB 985" /LENGTH=76 /DNA_ID=CAMNT_0015926287 /DNA_START=37 /DNA_END=264 /DNA_ORIENTATION=-
MALTPFTLRPVKYRQPDDDATRDQEPNVLERNDQSAVKGESLAKYLARRRDRTTGTDVATNIEQVRQPTKEETLAR